MLPFIDASAFADDAERLRDAVLMFGSLTVHGACPNLSGTRLRLSADYRYRPALAAVSDLGEIG